MEQIIHMNDLSVFRINQTGYAAGLPVCISYLGEGTVHLTDHSGNTIRKITCPRSPVDKASGDPVSVLNLGVLPEGRYKLESNGFSRNISVSQNPWQSVMEMMAKGLYFQRCGCDLKKEFADIYAHPACHTAPAADWENRETVRLVTGGWHDAGDYGKYVGPGAVTVGHLLYAWKLFPDSFSRLLNIPESGNGIPDVLNEARYELDWILKMQRPDGAFYHKLTKDHFAPFIMPQDDTDPEYLIPVSHCATAAACACLALASRVFRDYDLDFSGNALTAALRGWKWLEGNPDFIPFRNPEGVRTGWYGESTDSDDRFWAACELFAATGENAFREAAEELYQDGQNLTQYGWADVGGMGALCCLFDLREKAGTILYSCMKSEFLRQSENALILSSASGYGTSLSPDHYVWGSILPIMANAVSMIINYVLTGREDMRDAALLQWHYALGMNALDLCFVTGMGEKSVMHPHHRPSGSDGIDAPVPGLIVGGPNKCFPYPVHRERLGEDLPPAKYYLDELPSADTNEIAIYWNSPTIFVGAFFIMLSHFR